MDLIFGLKIESKFENWISNFEEECVYIFFIFIFFEGPATLDVSMRFFHQCFFSFFGTH